MKEALLWIIKIKDRLKELKINEPEIDAFDPYYNTSSTDEENSGDDESEDEVIPAIVNETGALFGLDAPGKIYLL